jgi:hypothetical protein
MLEATRKGAAADLERLVGRLQAALELHDREAEEWRTTLPALLAPAARGLWPQAARLLYDLQKVCVDYERDIYAVDLVEWIVSAFRQPIKRPLPLQADVLLVKHLRSAARRLGPGPPRRRGPPPPGHPAALGHPQLRGAAARAPAADPDRGA